MYNCGDCSRQPCIQCVACSHMACILYVATDMYPKFGLYQWMEFDTGIELCSRHNYIFNDDRS